MDLNMGNSTLDDYSITYDHTKEDYEYSEYIYPGFSFERPVYTYVWGILVIITFLANILVISVLLRKKMRNPTNLILVAIAISDSLTGLITLPSYWAVFSKHVPATSWTFNTCDFQLSTPFGSLDYGGQGDMFGVTYPTSNFTQQSGAPSSGGTVTVPHFIQMVTSTQGQTHHSVANPMTFWGMENSTNECINQTFSGKEGYSLDKNLCRFFMISKYFLSKTFHTISIWLTLFLGFQRFISVASPFRAQKYFSETRIIIACVVICCLAPLLHIYHLVDEKATQGMCQWDADLGCDETCAFIIVTFVLRHFLPCCLLVIFTILFIVQLSSSSSRLSRIDSNMGTSTMQHRDSENRRVSIIVTLIVLVFLIPEVPYGGFLLRTVIDQVNKTHMDLESNRAVHLAYEISLVLSFHANFYIYTFFNRRFRKSLLKTIVFPVLHVCGVTPAYDLTSSLSGSRRRTAQTDTSTKVEMKNIIHQSGERINNRTPESSRSLNGKSHQPEVEINEESKFLNDEPHLDA